MKGRLIIREGIEVSDIEMVKVFLKTVGNLSSDTSNKFDELMMRLVGENKIKQSEVEAIIKEMIEQLRIGELIEERRLELTKKGRQWLRKKITELR